MRLYDDVRIKKTGEVGFIISIGDHAYKVKYWHESEFISMYFTDWFSEAELELVE